MKARARLFVPRLRLLLALSGGTAAVLAGATETAGLTLKAALESALRQSPGLRVQAEVIEQKEGVREQATGAFDWNLSSGVTVAKDRTPVPGLPGFEPVDSSTETTYSVGVGRVFRNGISIQPSVGASVVDTHSAAAPTTGAAQLSFQIDVPLLRGLGTDSTGAAEAAARGDVRVARLLYQHALAAQAHRTAMAYWSSRAADEILLLQQDVEKAAERLVESTKVLVETRIFPPAFQMQAEANLRDKRTVRIEAELGAKSARIALGQALGLEPEAIAGTPGAADGFPALAAAERLLSESRRPELLRRALGARADLGATRESLVPLNLLARQAERDLRPRLDLTLRAGYKGLSSGNDLLAPLNERLTGANGQVGVTVAWPMRNTYQRGVLRERRADVRAAEAQAAELAQVIAGEVLVALEQVRLRADAVRSAQDTVEISRKALAAQYEQLRSGDGTILDVISLENLSVGARIRYVNAHAAYAIAVAQLRYALGAVFEPAAGTENSLVLTDVSQLPTF